MKILLVDDELPIVQVFEQALQKGGHTVNIAITGKEGVDKAIADIPDVILLDQVLPDISGNQALQQLKSRNETKNIPVAILSNFNQPNLIDEAMKLGAVEYILKYQVSPQDLLDKVQQLAQAKKGSGWQDTEDNIVI